MPPDHRSHEKQIPLYSRTVHEWRTSVSHVTKSSLQGNKPSNAMVVWNGTTEPVTLVSVIFCSFSWILYNVPYLTLNLLTFNTGKCNLLQFFVNSLHCSLPHSFIISQAFLNKSIEKLSTPAREYSGCVSPVRCQLRRVLESHQSRQPPF